jgi:hypothetical protein
VETCFSLRDERDELQKVTLGWRDLKRKKTEQQINLKLKGKTRRKRRNSHHHQTTRYNEAWFAANMSAESTHSSP